MKTPPDHFLTSVLKTANHFPLFRPDQSRLIRADSPGATPSDLAAFRWQKMSHPTYPGDEISDGRAQGR